ncbi:hypothetical protein GH714_012996 [Hevea brasiliensis]|uniref:RING-type domain-containing protein n=1 Tax=Hevea brasiliensis TaxID=3981 RepID=A0A6A6MTL2_HEVBR|nr:hypothetical protein GH714_012996 [Hevea brasiliensis]
MSQLFSTLLFGDNEEFESFLGDELKGFKGRLSGSQESSLTLHLPLLVLMGNEDDALEMAELATDEDGPRTQPASAQFVEKLEMIRIEESGLVCSICSGQLRVGSEARRLPCSHVYHGNCIMEWLQKMNLQCRHEIVGVVTKVGSKVDKFLTYGAKDYDGTIIYGGCSDITVADEHFIVRVLDTLPLDATTPSFVLESQLKFAKDMGDKVTLISTSPSEKHEAIENLSVDSFLAVMDIMNGIIDTESAMHPLVLLIGLLKTNGKLVLVGALEKPFELAAFSLLMVTGRKMVGGSGIGGMEGTQEMINFTAKHDITADIEVIPIEYVNTTVERILKADVRYQFVIDIGNTIKTTQ